MGEGRVSGEVKCVKIFCSIEDNSKSTVFVLTMTM